MIQATPPENVPSDMCAQQRIKSAFVCMQSDQSLHCPHEETLHTLSKMHPLKILIRLHNAQADLNLCWVHLSKGIFSDLVALMWNKMLYYNNPKYWDRMALANNVNPDQTLQNETSDQSLHCLSYKQQYFRYINR